jgi:hypothetical protein
MSSTKAPPNGPPAKTNMVRTQANYDALVAAYRAAPNNHVAASRATGWSKEACSTAWTTGWVKTRGHVAVPGCGPIREVLQAEKDRARTEAADRARKERDLEDAKLEAQRLAREEALTQEAELMNENRKGLLSLAKTIRSLAGVMPAFAKVVQDAVTEPDPKDPRQLIPLAKPLVNAMQAAKIIRDMASISNRVAYAASALVELARLDRGQSTQNVAVVDLEDPADVLDELAASATLYDRLKAAAGAQAGDPPEDEDPPQLQ